MAKETKRDALINTSMMLFETKFENKLTESDFKILKTNLERSWDNGFEIGVSNSDNDLNKLLSHDNPWPLNDVLKKLIEASEILLHDLNYDGDGWEKIDICKKRGEDIIEIIEYIENKKFKK